MTVDEQLLPCKSRCGFIQFMPKKPDKFGIKFWLLVDLDTKYVVNGFPYLGKDDAKPDKELQGTYVVKKLTEPYYNLGHNITTDNFFTSYNLATFLLTKKTTLVGTILRNRKGCPTQLPTSLNLYSSKFYENEKGVLFTIYQGKQNKNVSLISTMHEKAEINTTVSLVPGKQKNKPKIIEYYNSTKCGVDSVDQMTRHLSVKYPSRRWPIQVWSNILNIASINSWVLFKQANNSKIARRIFLQKLVDEIVDHLKPESDETETEIDNVFSKKRKQSLDKSIIASESPKLKTNCKIKLCNNNRSVGECYKCEKSVYGRCIEITKHLC
jgi:hypothetical protein